MDAHAPHPRIAEFERACADAKVDPLDVVTRAGVHRSQWFRWRRGKFQPSLTSWDRVQETFQRLTDQRPAA